MKRSTSCSIEACTIAPVSALLTSVRVKGSLWKLAIPPTIAARWITWEQPFEAPRGPPRARADRRGGARSPRASRPAARGDRRPAPPTAGSRSRRRTTAAPMFPAPPVTSTRAISCRCPDWRGRRPRLAAAGWPRRRRGTPGPSRGSSTDRRAGTPGGQGEDLAQPLRRRRRPSGWWPRSPRRRRAPRRSSGWVGVAAWGSLTATSASSRSSRRISLGDSESRSSSVSRLKVRPSTATLREPEAARAGA